MQTNFVVSKETAEEAKISDEMKEILVKKGEDLSKIKLFKVEFQHTSDDGSVVINSKISSLLSLFSFA
jgi:hypothetical protein